MKNLLTLTNNSLIIRRGVKCLLLLFLLLSQKKGICQPGEIPSLNLEWSISNVGVVLYPCVSSFSATATYENIPIGSTITIIAPSGFIVTGNNITDASGTNTFVFTYSNYTGDPLTFDCFVTLPDLSVVEAEFSGPPTLSVLPSSNLLTIFEGAPNPIEFFGHSNVSYNSLVATTFNRSVKVRILSSEITALSVAYADELDVNEVTNSPVGGIPGQSLPMEGGYRVYTFNQTVWLNSKL